jgi:hypothetical protein
MYMAALTLGVIGSEGSLGAVTMRAYRATMPAFMQPRSWVALWGMIALVWLPKFYGYER